MVVIKRSVDAKWKVVMDLLHSRLSQNVEMVCMAADRVVVWCNDEAERSMSLTGKSLFYRRNIIARMEPWSIFSHWEHVQIEARNSWIGVEGLPLNLWNVHAFKVTCEACGGLLEVAKETLD